MFLAKADDLSQEEVKSEDWFQLSLSEQVCIRSGKRYRSIARIQILNIALIAILWQHAIYTVWSSFLKGTQMTSEYSNTESDSPEPAYPDPAVQVSDYESALDDLATLTAEALPLVPQFAMLAETIEQQTRFATSAVYTLIALFASSFAMWMLPGFAIKAGQQEYVISAMVVIGFGIAGATLISFRLIASARNVRIARRYLERELGEIEPDLNGIFETEPTMPHASEGRANASY